MIRCAALLAMLLALFASGCATRAVGTVSTQQPAGAVFVLVRHGEKAEDDPKDPTLSEAGTARAMRLAASLADARLTAAYTTKYRRTQLTAAPAAASQRLAVQTYDASSTADAFAAQLLRDHPSGTVLVVGHSNTIPALASALCRCEVAPMGEEEFDRWIEIEVGIDPAGRISLVQRRY